jgi:8-oxo-dGTP pyrophosphatase MutT (NUDIX family)
MADWKTLSRRVLLDALPWFRVIEEEVQLPNGQVIPDFHLVEGPDFTSVVALTPADEVLLLYGYLHGVRQQVYALPGGLIEGKEGPLQTIQRELREETGCTAATWEPLGSFTLDGNRRYYTGHLFLARGAVQVQAPTTHDLETRHVERMPLEQAHQRWLQGDFATLPMMTAIGLALHRLG